MVVVVQGPDVHLAQDASQMRQVEVLKYKRESSGFCPSGLTEATGLAGSVVVQVGFALWGSCGYPEPFLSRIDLRLKAIKGLVLLQKTGGCSGKAAYLFIGSSPARVGLSCRDFFFH